MKKLLLILLPVLISAQSQVHVQAGYKAFEVGYSFTDENTELIFGSSVSIVDAEIAENRANKNDRGKIHKFENNVAAVFVLAGARFDQISIIGKIGGAYLNQSINNKPEPQNIYLAFGVILGYEISDRLGVVVNYDSVNAVMGGVKYKL